MGRASKVSKDRRVRVWDLPTRVFHWSLVCLVAAAAVTGFLAPEWWMGVHVAAGYLLVGLMVFRLAWGLFGSEYSRIVSFLYPPRDTFEHLKGLLWLRPPHYVGHNPTGALMVFGLLAILLALAGTGLLLLGGEERQGPLAAVVPYSVGLVAKRLHPWLAGILFAMVACHVAGVLAESILSRENLVGAMITGWKRLPAGAPVPSPRAARPVPALALLLGFFLAGAAGLEWLSRLPPAYSLRALPANALHRKECGACHSAHHPSLLPAASWAGLMAGLDEHFGEDARLSPERTRSLTAWLVGNAAETFDTEAANRLRAVSPEAPYRITATPFWKRKHAGIPPEVFARTAVRSRVNCNACHRDAEDGRFDDQRISIPQEEKT